YRHCDPSGRQRTGDRHLQAAGRFKNHKVSRLELPEQLADSNLVVSNRKSLSVRPDEHFQLRLGNVDPNKAFLITHLLTSSAWLAPPCNPGSFSRTTVRAKSTAGGAATLAARRDFPPKDAPV